MRLAIDVMGFENDISEAINACRKFQKHHEDVCFILVGKKSEIHPHLYNNNEFEILNADDIVTMNDSPMLAMRKTNSSMYKAVECVKNGKADGVLSAGSSTCYVPMSYLLLDLVDGIKKPAFMPYLPTVNKKGLMMLDVGANKECSGIDLYQFAKMATIYLQSIKGIDKPTVGIINIGTEIEKGFTYHREGYELIQRDHSINFRGFIEPRNLIDGIVDIAVCDGYTGNIVLKSLEGGLGSLKNALKKGYKKPQNWIGALFSLGLIKEVSRTFDYKNNAGAMVIGLKKIAVKTHGNADQRQFFSSIRMLYEAVKVNIVDKISKAMK